MTLALPSPPLPLHFATFPVVCLGMRGWSSCCLHRLLFFQVWQLVVLIVHFFLGGRTAWSSSVKLQGRTFAARYWYDGVFVNNAREDAAEVALFILDPENHQARATTTYPGQLWPQQNTSFQQQRSYWSVSFLREAIFVCFIFLLLLLLFLFGEPNCLTFFFRFFHFSFFLSFFPPPPLSSLLASFTIAYDTFRVNTNTMRVRSCMYNG